mmetsp:Transcript_44957/g.101130  ORF Transcript_44957/g.101130 Transcript_44957/m.101130 type:complete len:333 (+) Transcript_44957:1781-2779(+)
MLSHVLNPRVGEDRQPEAHPLQGVANEPCTRGELHAIDDLLHDLCALALEHGDLVQVLVGGSVRMAVCACLRRGLWVDPRLLQDLVQAVVRAEHVREAKHHEGLAVRAIHGIPPPDGDLRIVIGRRLLQALRRCARRSGCTQVERGELDALRALHAEHHLVVFGVVLPLVVAAVLDLHDDAALLAESRINIVEQPRSDCLRGHEADGRHVLLRRCMVSLVLIWEMEVELQLPLLGAPCEVLHEAHGAILAKGEHKGEHQGTLKEKLGHVKHPALVLQDHLHEGVGDTRPVGAPASDDHDIAPILSHLRRRCCFHRHRASSAEGPGRVPEPVA